MEKNSQDFLIIQIYIILFPMHMQQDDIWNIKYFAF